MDMFLPEIKQQILSDDFNGEQIVRKRVSCQSYSLLYMYFFRKIIFMYYWPKIKLL